MLNEYFTLLGITGGLNLSDPAHAVLFKRSVGEAKTLLNMSGDDEGKVIQRMREVASWARERGLDWSISTVVKRWLQRAPLPPEKKLFTAGEKRNPVGVQRGLERLKDIFDRRRLP